LGLDPVVDAVGGVEGLAALHQLFGRGGEEAGPARVFEVAADRHAQFAGEGGDLGVFDAVEVGDLGGEGGFELGLGGGPKVEAGGFKGWRCRRATADGAR
jgi:hypothetical protein